MLVSLSFPLFAQLELAPDTVYFSERIGGSFETFDRTLGTLPSTFDGGVAHTGIDGLSVQRLFYDMSNGRLQMPVSYEKLRYSSIPHLGFAYSFGSQATQFLKMNYAQAFSSKLIFNMNYDRTTGSGFVRNARFTQDNVRIQLQRKAKRYSFYLKGSFLSDTLRHSGGLATDTLVQAFGLEFSPVNKNAASLTRRGHIGLQNFINFGRDSINQFGLITKHDYEINHREFVEALVSGDTSSTIPGYSMFNYDSLRTEDTWNNPSIRNAAGLYFLNETSNLYVDGVVAHKYWNSRDKRDLRDTSEISIASELRMQWGSVLLSNSMELNLIGGFNGWYENASVGYETDKLKVSGSLKLTSLPANAIQRFYFGNNYEYTLATVNRQVTTSLGGDASYKKSDSTWSVGASGRYFTLTSVYTFDGSSWQLNDSLGSAVSLNVTGKLHLGPLVAIPELVFAADKYGYLPNFQGNMRLELNGRLFKAKRLQAMIGLDLNYTTPFKARTYIASMDTYDWSGAGLRTPNMFNAHVFAAMGIEQFRFYFRFENLGYFWNDRTIQEMNGYPIAGTRIRVGITWDFFN